MAISPNAIYIGVVFLLTGSVNTLAAKWANLLKGDGGDGVMTTFKHPFLQSWGMFLGETLCLLAFYVMIWLKPKPKPGEIDLDDAIPEYERPKPFNMLILLPPVRWNVSWRYSF